MLIPPLESWSRSQSWSRSRSQSQSRSRSQSQSRSRSRSGSGSGSWSRLIYILFEYSAFQRKRLSDHYEFIESHGFPEAAIAMLIGEKRMSTNKSNSTIPNAPYPIVGTNKPHPFAAGESYFIRTVTFHLIGRVVGTTGDFLELEKASWIADSGRFTNALLKGVSELGEVEPVGPAFVNLSAITDAFPWPHKLPDKQK